MTLFIGDVHGKYKRYKRIITGRQNSIQVGDMGIGFLRPNGNPYQNPPHYLMAPNGHRFIRGNHDNPGECRRQSQWIADGRIEGGMMFIGGAFSDDREWRTEGHNWWPDEELNVAELNTLAHLYAVTRPRAMVTHDCPEGVAARISALSGEDKLVPSWTQHALQAMFETHQPDLWLFGHWHYSFDEVIDGTRFVCLAELEAREFDVG